MELKTLDYSVNDGIARITLCRPAELNTMNGDFWPEMVQVFRAIEHDMAVRCRRQSYSAARRHRRCPRRKARAAPRVRRVTAP